MIRDSVKEFNVGIGIIPLISAIVSFVFGIIVLDQYFARRQPFQLLWTIGLFMYVSARSRNFTLKPMVTPGYVPTLVFIRSYLCRSFLGQGQYIFWQNAAPLIS